MRKLKRDLAAFRREDIKTLKMGIRQARENDALNTAYRLRVTLIEVDVAHGNTIAHEYAMPVEPERVWATEYNPRIVSLRTREPILFTANGYPKDWPENPKPSDTVKMDGHEILGPR